jgi:hypothetical protein
MIDFQYIFLPHSYTHQLTHQLRRGEHVRAVARQAGDAMRFASADHQTRQ